MGININKFITKRMRWGADMTELNHLGAAALIKPYKFEGILTRIFAAETYADNPLSQMMLGKERTITSNEWEWDLEGANTRPLTVIEKVDESDAPGKWGESFKIKFDEDWWVEGDVITPGTQFQEFQCRIKHNPYRSGNGFIYELELVSDDNTRFVPAQYLNPGWSWGKLYSTYGEAATRGGSMDFSAPISMRNKLGKIRKQYKVTDYAAEEVLAVKLIDREGRVYNKWTNYAEVECNRKWQREIEYAYWFNRTGNIIGENGRKVDSFPGIIQQIQEGGWNYAYNVLSAKLINEFMMDIYFGRVAPGNQRHITAWTGEVGMIKFNEMMQDVFAKNGWVITNSNWSPVQKASSPMHQNAYSLGYQFVEYRMPNGCTLTLNHLPLLDDTQINFDRDEISGYPKSSSMFLFLDFAPAGKSKSNIELINKADGFKFGYVNGLVSPYGPLRGGSAAHSGEFYEMSFSKEFGIHIEDTTRCGMLYMN